MGEDCDQKILLSVIILVMILGTVLASLLDLHRPDEQQAPDEDTSSKIHGIDEPAASEHVDSGMEPDSIRRIVHEPHTDHTAREKLLPGIHGIPYQDWPGGMEPVEGIEPINIRCEYMEPMVKPLSPSPWDWIVTGNETRRDEVIVLNGNLVVEPGAILH